MLNSRVKIDQKGVKQFLDSPDMERYLKGLAQKMTGGDTRYDIQVHNRPSRKAINIRDLNRNAVYHEMRHGKLQRMAITYIPNS